LNNPSSDQYQSKTIGSIAEGLSPAIKSMSMKLNNWQKGLLKFLLFVMVGFACAFIYRQMKHS